MSCRPGPALALFVVAGWSLAGQTAPPARAAETLTGTVVRGEAFERPLREGLAFRLVPGSHGWILWIGDPARPDENYAAVATPPLRGPNPLDIQGWHFRNADNTGPNTAGPKNLNVPQRLRAFAFVRDRPAFLAASDALGVALWPAGHTAGQVAAALAAYERLEKGTGRLEITGLELGNLAAGERAWIERMEFRLTIGPASGAP